MEHDRGEAADKPRTPSSAQRFLFLAAVMLFLAQAFGWLGGYWVLADIFNHAVPFYLSFAAFLTLCSSFMRARRAAALAFAAFVIAVLRIAPLYIHSAEVAPEDSESISIVVANTNYENKNTQPTIDLIEKWDQPDLLVFPEFNDRWRVEIHAIERYYPHAFHVGVTNDQYGVSLYSNNPIDRLDISPWPNLKHRAIAARVHHPAGEFTLIAAHPSPLHSETEMHVADMRALAECAATLPKPIVVAGDFNSTPWSPNFARLNKAANLTDARQGRGLLPTWPDTTNCPPFLLLDACLAGPEFHIEAFEVGPSIASDHFPVRTTLQFKKENQGPQARPSQIVVQASSLPLLINYRGHIATTLPNCGAGF